MRDPSLIPHWDYFDDAHPPISDYDQIEIPEVGGYRPRLWLATHGDQIREAALFRARPHAYVGIDESGDLKSENALLIGAVICRDLAGFYADWDKIRRHFAEAPHPDHFPLDEEPKYTGTDRRRVAIVRALIDLFFDRDDMSLAVMIARKEIGSVKHFKNNQEGWTPKLFGFDWYLSTLMRRRLSSEYRYTIRLDHNLSLDRARIPQRLERYNRNVEWATLEDSNREPLIQMADILTGCVAAAYNTQAAGTRAAVQERFIERIAELGVHDLRGSVRLDKVNLWPFQPSTSTTTYLNLTQELSPRSTRKRYSVSATSA